MASWAYDQYRAVPFRTYGLNECGWTNDDYREGRYQLTLYAGICNNDVRNSLKVGTLSITYERGKIKAKFNIDPAYSAQDLRPYIGKKPLPVTRSGNMTTNPQQFPCSLQNGAEFTVPGPVLQTGNIFVTGYAVVCSNEN